MLEYVINGKISNINVGMQNQHAVKIDEHFSRVHTKDDLLKLKELCSKLKVYFICFTNRCGSNLVYESLSTNGIIKEPIEILNFDNVIAKSSIEKFNCYVDYLCWAIKEKESSGMAGLKIGIAQLLHIYNLGILKVIPNPSFIFVRRKNVLKQAISMWIATHTKQWASFQKKKFELPNVLNVDDIFKFVNNIMNKNAAFESFFLISNIKPHRVQYEEFINDPISHVDKISEFLGSDKISYIPSMNKYKKQSTNLNEEIYQKIIENYQLKP